MKFSLSYCNHKKYLIGSVVFGLLLSIIQLSGFLSSSSASAPSQVSDILYLPSPFEGELLGPEYKIWPGQFGPDSPITPEGVPSLYTAALRSGRAVGWTSQELITARRWSLALNSRNLPQLRAQIGDVVKDPRELLGKKKPDGTCSLLEREALFRWTQIDTQLREDYVRYLDKCKASGVVKDWLELQIALERRQDSVRERVTQRLKLRSHVPDRSWNRWFAEKAVKYVELATRSDDQGEGEELLEGDSK